MTVSGSPMSLSLQLQEYDPCLGICSFRSSKRGCFYCDKASTPPGFPFPCSYSSHSKIFLRFKLLGTNSSYSSSPVTNDRGDLAGASFVSDGNSGQDTSQGSVLSDCLSAAENGRVPQSEELTLVAGGMVALGKFGALHIGHRELAIQAAKIGVPFLLSFVGMAEILGWEPRAPVVAKCDRKRVLSSWAPLCGNIIPKEFHIEFSKVRHLTPQQFVEKLSKELGVYGVVAGQNYRFGYRAAGNASDLVRLCEEYGMRACIINSVMDQNQESRDMDYGNSKEHGQVSSTRVRYALAKGDMKYVSELLGRRHRLILVFKDKEKFSGDRKWLSAPRSWLLNLAPKEGLYKHCSIVTGEESVVPCRVIIDTTDIHLQLDELAPCTNIAGQNLLSIEFGDSNV